MEPDKKTLWYSAKLFMCYCKSFKAHCRSYVRSPCTMNFTWTGELEHGFLEVQAYKKPQEKPFFNEMPQVQRWSYHSGSQ